MVKILTTKHRDNNAPRKLRHDGTNNLLGHGEQTYYCIILHVHIHITLYLFGHVAKTIVDYITFDE